MDPLALAAHLRFNAACTGQATWGGGGYQTRCVYQASVLPKNRPLSASQKICMFAVGQFGWQNSSKAPEGKVARHVEKWAKWNRNKWEICPKLSHFFPLQFPTNFTHLFYISHYVFLAVSHISPCPPLSPQFSPFPPIFPHFLPFSSIFLFPHFSLPLRPVGYFGCG